MNNYTIRTMSASEVAEIAIELARAEGWNPGLHDAECFYTADPNGFFVGMLGDVPIACISAVAYNEEFGFIGLYIVKPEYRGQGYGISIWNAAMDYLQQRNIGLDGVVAQQENYKKSGFALAYRNIRFEGISIAAEAQFPDISPVADGSINDLLHYDSTLFPAPRPRFLRQWIEQPGSTTLVSVQNGNIAGYGTIRTCHSGYKIGPLFAQNPDTAERLFLALNKTVAPGSAVYLDTPEVNTHATALARKYNMTVVFETARMYTGSQPDINMNSVFGVTTFELG